MLLYQNKKKLEAKHINSHKRQSRFSLKCCASTQNLASGSITFTIGAILETLFPVETQSNNEVINIKINKYEKVNPNDALQFNDIAIYCPAKKRDHI